MRILILCSEHEWTRDVCPVVGFPKYKPDENRKMMSTVWQYHFWYSIKISKTMCILHNEHIYSKNVKTWARKMDTTLGQWPPLERGMERGSGILEKHKRRYLFNLECFSFEKKMKQIGQNVDICETWVLAILHCSFPFI